MCVCVCVCVHARVCKLQSMLDICVEFGVQFGFTFNAGKSCCLAFGERDITNKLPEMNVDNSFVDWVLEAKYLGVTVCFGLSFMSSVYE